MNNNEEYEALMTPEDFETFCEDYDDEKMTAYSRPNEPEVVTIVSHEVDYNTDPPGMIRVKLRMSIRNFA